MSDNKKIEIVFSEQELPFYEKLVEYCTADNIGVSDYIKDLIKRDVAWGHFAKRKKHKPGRKY
jgi:hypothetical protein